MKYDIIIVGAGPAGSAAAIQLAQAGRQVLLLDRQAFPRDKSCGDGIPPGSMQLLHELGLKPALKKAEFCDIRNIHFTTPGGHCLQTSIASRRKNGGFVVAPRLDFDYLLQQHAIQSGAEFRQAAVQSLCMEDGFVSGVVTNGDASEETFSAKLVIGADGCSSVVARELGVAKQSPGHQFVAVRAYTESVNIKPETVEFHWFKPLLPGYGWIFPLSEKKANVGVAIRTDVYRKRKHRLPDLLNAFLTQPEMQQRVQNGLDLQNVRSWPLNLASRQKMPRVFDGAMLVGDAAAFIDPFSGEGIHNALVSAKIAAKTADAALAANDVSRAFLKQYDDHCQQTFSRIFRRSYFLQRAMLHAPLLIDSLAYLLKKNHWFLKTAANKFSVDFQFDVQ